MVCGRKFKFMLSYAIPMVGLCMHVMSFFFLCSNFRRKARKLTSFGECFPSQLSDVFNIQYNKDDNS
jgi:hypothetical protein